MYKNFIEKPGGLDVGFQADGLTGGVLLGVTGQGGVSFFDWATGGLVRRIEVEPKQVYWSDSGELVAIACEDTFYILRFSRENYVEAVQSGEIEEDGVESAFEVITDISESVRTGEWVGDCFIYTNSTNRLNYLVGDQTHTVSHFDKSMYILGYIQRDSRIYLADKDVNVTSFALSLPVLEYQTLVSILPFFQEVLIDTSRCCGETQRQLLSCYLRYPRTSSTRLHDSLRARARRN